jgi:hypothetical protein
VASRAEAGRGRAGGVTWQKRLDRMFPDGAFVHVVQDVPEEEDGPTYVCPRIMVTKEDLKRPELMLVAPGVKSTYITLTEIEDYATTPTRQDVLFHTEIGDIYRVTSYLTDFSRQFAHQERTQHPDLYGEPT